VNPNFTSNGLTYPQQKWGPNGAARWRGMPLSAIISGFSPNSETRRVFSH